MGRVQKAQEARYGKSQWLDQRTELSYNTLEDTKQELDGRPPRMPSAEIVSRSKSDSQCSPRSDAIQNQVTVFAELCKDSPNLLAELRKIQTHVNSKVGDAEATGETEECQATGETSLE